MADISVIKLPSGTSYNIKDQTARNLIDEALDLIDEMSGYTDFLGVTTTALTDGANTNPIKINNANVTAEKGNIVTYGSAEFIFNGASWQAFGDLSGLGSLAYKNSVSGSTTVAVPKTYTTTVTPKAKDVSVSGTTTGSITPTKKAVGIVEIGNPAGLDADHKYTPIGTNSASSVSGSCTVTPSGTISKGTGTANYTPQGTVSTPTITVTPNTATKYVASSATGGGSVTAGTAASCTLPSLSATVSGETLTLGWSAGSFTANTPTAVTLPSFASQTIATGIKSATSSQPTFTGTGAELKFTGSSSTGTISGTAAAQNFTGEATGFKVDEDVMTGASFVGASMTSTGSYTPATPTATTTTATTENKTVSITSS